MPARKSAKALRAEETQRRLITTAERLFAEHGIDAVSIRTINAEADVNNAALHYHFGSKFGLIRAILDRRVSEVNRDREERLRTLEGGPVTVAGIADAWLQPLAALAFDASLEGHHYVRFCAAILASTDSPEVRAIGRELFVPHAARFASLLERMLPGVPPDERNLRFQLMREMSVLALASATSPTGDLRSAMPPARFVPALRTILAGVLSGPP